MPGELFVKLNALLIRNKGAFYISLAIITGILGYGVSRLRISESIFATLPKGKSFQEFNRLVESKNFINQIVFSLERAPGQDLYETEERVMELADSLQTFSRITHISESHPDAQQIIYQWSRQNFAVLIDSSYYAVFDHRTHPDSIGNTVAKVRQQLLAPGGGFVKSFLLDDPLGLSSPYFQQLNKTNNRSNLTVEDGLLLSADGRQVMVLANTAYPSGDSRQDLLLSEELDAFKERWNLRYPDQPLQYFGTFEISARNAKQIKTDSYLTALLSLGLILSLLYWYYRKIGIPLLLALPGAFGALFALGMIGFFRPEVSGLSLATGAAIFGILLDYAIHFFTHYQHERSISRVLNDISAPLLTGSFTTLLAFGALLFANSSVLQDFGLFASLGLFGAALFTLVALPVLIHSWGLKWDHTSKGAPRLPGLSPVWNRYPFMTLGFIFLATLFFLYHAQNIRFDSQFENLSLQDEGLQSREAQLTGLDPSKEKRIYVFAENADQQKAAEANFRAYQLLTNLQSKGMVGNFLSAAAWVIPQPTHRLRTQRWETYWTPEKKQETISLLRQQASQQGFEPDAFEGFESWLNRSDTTGHPHALLERIGMGNLVNTEATKTTYITPITLPNTSVAGVKERLRSLEGIVVFDRGELASELVTLVKDDFNYLLALSASVVFITLLLVFGRIELALLTFLPMVISWIWILGMAALLGIEFNFVNVVVTTFIFGLGDDFSIFVSNGLLQKYQYRRNSLASYRSAILLSGFTTLLGTGCLIFAKHPAIHSIALISMLGITCILLMSFVVQPVLFHIFIQNRIDKGKAPVTFLPFLISVSSFTYFLVGCLIMHSHLVTIALLPISRIKKRNLMNGALSFYARTVIYSGPHVRKNISGLAHINPEKPAIFIANHSSFLDILLTIMINPRMVLMVKGWVYNSPFFGPLIRYAGYMHAENGPEKNLADARKLIADGYSILLFPEGTRSPDGRIARFHKGAFLLAMELGVPVQPILIHGASEVLPKNDFVIQKGALNVRVLPPIDIQDPIWGQQLRDKTKNISTYFKSAHHAFTQEMETPRYLKHRIFTNYVFKGPVLEWYFKIKWQLEAENFEQYHQEIGSRKRILDIGCGYGYLSFYLHYKDPDRFVTGIDYDAEKISIAEHAYNKTERLQFVNGDIMQQDLGEQDVIFLNDVLHYLSAEKQTLLLSRCAAALSNEGMLFIRDGVTDFSALHKNTRLTEKLSTGLFNFNKKKEDFHFFHSDEIARFALAHKMELKVKRHSEKTSNVLFTLKRASY
ncbi:1-acyl-sn-glycerol-3-phosphate acyltransferase [Dyadobacter tibetensis]|uniref:1-acyl-sn-glycerol-3-phosphate acyltransferase n=1 Tax=Dyadobacter tibetensis TaxID=1211851 RepID=UPI0004728FF1|nr:1-acyl-sn-glycerol-3-phosphate acyltransferase [Dyadobacter tibetensis]